MDINVTVFLLLMHMYTESLHTFFWAVSGTRLDLSFSFPSATFQVQMNLKGRLVIPNLAFPVGHKYEAADSDCMFYYLQTSYSFVIFVF